VTHAKNAARTDGMIAVEAAQHTLGLFGMTIVRKENGEPGRCPKCSSYRLTTDYRPELGIEHAKVRRCEACGWEDLSADLDMSAVPDRDLSRPTRLEDFLDVAEVDATIERGLRRGHCRHSGCDQRPGTLISLGALMLSSRPRVTVLGQISTIVSQRGMAPST
jgi:hypothetical protein